MFRFSSLLPSHLHISLLEYVTSTLDMDPPKQTTTIPQTPRSIDSAYESDIDLAAEQKLVRKLDMWLAPLMALFVLVAYLDRSAIGISMSVLI